MSAPTNEFNKMRQGRMSVMILNPQGLKLKAGK